MKQLRILTGCHAGVQLSLSSSSYMIGANAEADIEIVDWTSEPLLLEVNGDIVQLRSGHHGEDSEGDGVEVLDDFAPRRFGDVAFCIGPATGAWPSDMDLLERLLRPPVIEPVPAPEPEAAAPEPVVAAAQARKTSRPVLALAGTAVTALLSIFIFVATGASSNAHPAERTRPLAEQVAQALAETKVQGVTLRSAGQELIVEGLVDDAVALRTLNSALRPFPDSQVRRHYASADDVAQQIVDSLGVPGVQARLRGNGVFVLSGSAHDVEALRAAATRVATDLAPLVSRIEVDAKSLPAADHEPVGAVYAAANVHIVQSRDGRKMLVVDEEPDAAPIFPPVSPGRRTALVEDRMAGAGE